MKFSLLVALMILLAMASPTLAEKKKPVATNTSSITSNDSSILSKFKSCKEANRAGVRNVSVAPGYTPPGWNHSADRDNDGIACEPKK